MYYPAAEMGSPVLTSKCDSIPQRCLRNDLQWDRPVRCTECYQVKGKVRQDKNQTKTNKPQLSNFKYSPCKGTWDCLHLRDEQTLQIVLKLWHRLGFSPDKWTETRSNEELDMQKGCQSRKGVLRKPKQGRRKAELPWLLSLRQQVPRLKIWNVYKPLSFFWKVVGCQRLSNQSEKWLNLQNSLLEFIQKFQTFQLEWIIAKPSRAAFHSLNSFNIFHCWVINYQYIPYVLLNLPTCFPSLGS